MTGARLIAAILRMLGGHHSKTCEHVTHAQQVAFEIPRALKAERSHLRQTLLAAVAKKESDFRWIVGKAGEIGWFQVKPDGQAEKYCTDLDIHRPDGNARCAVRLLELAKRVCGIDPLNYLSAYNGQSCGPSKYARRILWFETFAFDEVAATP